jgi:leucyl aminopeptidase
MTTLASTPLDAMTLETSSPSQIRTGVLVIGAFADATLPWSSQAIDAASRGKLAAILSLGDLGEKPGATMLLHNLPGVAAERVLVVSLGRRGEFGDKTFRDALRGAAGAIASGASETAAVALTDVDLPGRPLTWRLQQASLLLADGGYRFILPRGANTRTTVAQRGARRIALLVAAPATPELDDAVRRGLAIAEGIALTKDLGNLPGNICHPPYLADTALALGREFGFEVEVLEREDMSLLGMGAALAVGQASAHPCKFIVMHYKGGGVTARPVVLVGKCVTFDTGGISLKPGANMDEMKFDMCGGASVFGAMTTVARLELPISIVGLVPAVENMPGGNATRPGDVVTSMSGQTIEILNTDAEGRLALADALTYAERYAPACVVDIATLTGACVIALGHVASGLLANDEQLAEELLRCGHETGDRAWRLPMFDEYQDQLKSNFADMSNLGGRPAGTITAACFLARFARAYKWAHLDIAGTNALSGAAKGATGRPVPLLTEFLISRASRSTRQAA